MKKSNKRFQHSIGAKFRDEISEVNFLTSPSDIGVRKNLGRSGARFAPKVILNQFKKLNNHLKQASFANFTVSDHELEKQNFKTAQEKSTQEIFKILKTNKTCIHLGGGHDHAYPMLMAIDQLKNFENIVILNLDAHCDTRIDDNSHSGTPFRDYDKNGTKDFFLYQIGIHQFANSKDTMTQLERGKMYIEEFSSSFIPNRFDQVLKKECPFNITNKTFIYLSLDSDAIHSSIMSGVSAVNHHGLDINYICNLIDWLTVNEYQSCFGIYEYNPLFDDISVRGARALSFLIHHYLNKKY